MIRGSSGRWHLARNKLRSQAPKILSTMSVPVDVEIRLAQPADIASLETWSGFDTPAHRQALRYYLTMQDADLGALLVAAVDDYLVAQLFLWFHRDDPTLADGTKTISITAKTSVIQAMLRIPPPGTSQTIAAILSTPVILT